MRARLGQNFLVDKNTAQKIAGFLELSPEDTVIEVGPGRGILTRYIAPCVKRLAAVEIDRRLCASLENTFKESGNTDIICGDFMKWEIPGEIKEAVSLKFAGNLPYYLSTAVISRIIKLEKWNRAVFTVQKEVADRLTAVPGTRSYGSLTLLVKFYAETEKVLGIRPGSFRPVPEVDSGVVVLKPCRRNSGYSETFVGKLFGIIYGSFRHRRKTAYNSLAADESVLGALDRETLKKTLINCGIPENARAENITLEQYIEFTAKLDNIMNILYK